MLREEYGHSYRQCPVCKKEGLPPGIIVCCQNKKCTHVIDTGKEPWEDTGPYYQDHYFKDHVDTFKIRDVFIYAKEEKGTEKEELGYHKISEFVNKLPQKDMVLLDMVMKDRRRRYGRG